MSDALEAIQAELHQILKEVKETNGLVKRHEEEIFGNPEHNIDGIKLDVRALKIFAIQAKTVTRIAIVVVTFFGAANILLLIRGNGS